MVVAQLAQWLLLTSVDNGSNSAISKFYQEHLFSVHCTAKTKVNKKELGHGPILTTRLPHRSDVDISEGFKNGPFRPLFFFIFVFSIQSTVNKCSINFANDWIRTADLWYRKRPLYQLSHTTTALRYLRVTHLILIKFRMTCPTYLPRYPTNVLPIYLGTLPMSHLFLP